MNTLVKVLLLALIVTTVATCISKVTPESGAVSLQRGDEQTFYVESDESVTFYLNGENVGNGVTDGIGVSYHYLASEVGTRQLTVADTSSSFEWTITVEPNYIDDTLNYPSMAEIKNGLDQLNLTQILNSLCRDYNVWATNSEKEAFFSERLSAHDLTENTKNWLKAATHIIVVEKLNLVPWSLQDYTQEEIFNLFFEPVGWLDDDGTLTLDAMTPSYGGWEWLQNASPSYPRWNVNLGYRLPDLYLLANSFIKDDSKLLTLEALVQWMEKSFFHAYYEYGWEVYDSGQSLERIFEERVIGCHLPSIIASAMLRSINIPAQYIKTRGHGVLYIPEFERFVHGDYIADLAAIPASVLLMDKDTLLSWTATERGYLSFNDYILENSQTLYGNITLNRDDVYLYLSVSLFPEVFETYQSFYQEMLPEYNIDHSGFYDSDYASIKSLDTINQELLNASP